MKEIFFSKIVDQCNLVFITVNAVHCDSMVKVDAVLHDALVAKGDYVETMRWDDLVTRCLARMTHVHCVTFAGAETKVHRGRLEPIELDVVQRGSNKKVVAPQIRGVSHQHCTLYKFTRLLTRIVIIIVIIGRLRGLNIKHYF